jgi:hypothetical protein
MPGPSCSLQDTARPLLVDRQDLLGDQGRGLTRALEAVLTSGNDLSLVSVVSRCRVIHGPTTAQTAQGRPRSGSESGLLSLGYESGVSRLTAAHRSPVVPGHHGHGDLTVSRLAGCDGSARGVLVTDLVTRWRPRPGPEAEGASWRALAFFRSERGWDGPASAQGTRPHV